MQLGMDTITKTSRPGEGVKYQSQGTLRVLFVWTKPHTPVLPSQPLYCNQYQYPRRETVMLEEEGGKGPHQVVAETVAWRQFLWEPGESHQTLL